MVLFISNALCLLYKAANWLHFCAVGTNHFSCLFWPVVCCDGLGLALLGTAVLWRVFNLLLSTIDNCFCDQLLWKSSCSSQPSHDTHTGDSKYRTCNRTPTTASDIGTMGDRHPAINTTQHQVSKDNTHQPTDGPQEQTHAILLHWHSSSCSYCYYRTTELWRFYPFPSA